MTPCINICSLDKGICQGCYRTVEEITEWKDYSMAQRMEIMEQLEDRKNKLMKGSPCPSCGLGNNCFMDQGKSASLCWCMHEEKTKYVDVDTSSCYCKNCLNKVEIK